VNRKTFGIVRSYEKLLPRFIVENVFEEEICQRLKTITSSKWRRSFLFATSSRGPRFATGRLGNGKTDLVRSFRPLHDIDDVKTMLQLGVEYSAYNYSDATPTSASSLKEARRTVSTFPQYSSNIPWPPDIP